jgi:hypothetical protein
LVQVSVLIVNYNSWEVLLGGIQSLHAHPARDSRGVALDYEIIVVDNASPRRPAEAIEALRALLRPGQDQLVLHDQNGGYSTGMNLAYARSKGRYLLVSNPDVIYQEHCLTRLVQGLERDPMVGATAPVTFADPAHETRLPTGIVPRLLDRPRLCWAAVSARGVAHYSRLRTPRYLPIWRPKGDIDLEMFAGWGFMIRRDLVERIGFFDERYPLYFEDTDLSLRVLRAGYRIVQVHDADLVHLYNQSGKTAPDIVRERHDISERKFFRLWRGPWGALVIDLSRRFLKSAYAQRAGQRPRHGRLLPVSVQNGRPVIELPTACADFLVEIAFDPYFLLAAASFGQGKSWSPGPITTAHMQVDTYFRLVDLTTPQLREIGLWHFDPQRAAGQT